MDTFYDYFGYDEEKVDSFENYIEENFSYEKPGNQLFYHGGYVGGELSIDRKDEYTEELVLALSGLFQEERDWGSRNGIYTASHIIIAVRSLEEVMADEEISKLKLLVFLERPIETPEVAFYICPLENECFEYFIAVMK